MSDEDEHLLRQTRPIHSYSEHADEAGPSGLQVEVDNARPARARLALYASHALSTWGERMWEFDIGLVMLELHSDSLKLVSAYGLVSSTAQVLLGGYLGSYVDRTPRLQAATTMYLLQNSAVAVSALTAFLGLRTPHDGVLFWPLVVVTIIAGSISSLGAVGSTLSVEKEWTKVLCQGDATALASLNSGMRRIDLTCLIAAPIAAGMVITIWGTSAAICVIAIWNLAAWLPEYHLLTYAQQQAPVLRQPRAQASNGALKPAAKRFDPLASWTAYVRQPVLPAAVALALLYLTVLSFGLLMTAYLKWGGMTEAELSVWRGAGAAAGIAATFTFPSLRSHAGLVLAGLLGVCLQLGCLVLAVMPSVIGPLGHVLSSKGVIRVLVAGVAASRFGLWTFDLALTQMLQECCERRPVESAERFHLLELCCGPGAMAARALQVAHVGVCSDSGHGYSDIWLLQLHA